MLHNTKNYRSDFKYDKEILQNAAYSPQTNEQEFLWLSRYSGTHCFTKRAVFCQCTYAHNTWTHYGDTQNEKIQAFTVEIKGLENGMAVGDIYEVDLTEHANLVKQKALPPYSVVLVYDDNIKHIGYDERWEATIQKQSLKMTQTLPADLAEWDCILNEERVRLHSENFEAWDLKRLRDSHAELARPSQEKVADFLSPKQKGSKIGIYQLGNDSDKLFESYDRLTKNGKSVVFGDYNLIYIDDYHNESLEDIFFKFNEDIPQDFVGHSLSMSDVVVIKVGGTLKAYYTDRCGFKELENFLPDLAQSKKEMEM